MKHTDFKNDLKINGLKNTKHRASILEILGQKNQPIAAEELFIDLQKKGLSVNLSTVYRTLESLACKSLVNKLNISGDNRARYELNHRAHRHYLVCLECRKILPVEDCPLENYERTIEEKTSFKIEGHKLDIYGYCPECQKKKNLSL